MLSITVSGETFNNDTQEFVELKRPIELMLEHSLLSVSKWESIWRIPFLSSGIDNSNRKTPEQYRSYIKCMTINKGVPDEAYLLLTNEDFKKIGEYIDTERTATWFSDNEKKGNGDSTVVTSELIYYWMTAQQIPWEAEKWHLSRLLTLIRICSIKNGPQKKMSRQEILRRNHNLNEERKKALGSRG